MCVVGLEVQGDLYGPVCGILRGQFETPLHGKYIQEQKNIIIFNFHYELDGRLKFTEVLKKITAILLSVHVAKPRTYLRSA
jgi:hypothetical protein